VRAPADRGRAGDGAGHDDQPAQNDPCNIYFKNRQSRFLRINNKMSQYFGLRSPARRSANPISISSEEHARQAYDDGTAGDMLWASRSRKLRKRKHGPTARYLGVDTTKVGPARSPDGSLTGLVGISRGYPPSRKKEGGP